MQSKLRGAMDTIWDYTRLIICGKFVLVKNANRKENDVVRITKPYEFTNEHSIRKFATIRYSHIV